MQRSSCLRQRTLKWVQRHKLTVRFPPVNSIIYIWNHNFPAFVGRLCYTLLRVREAIRSFRFLCIYGI